MAGIAAGLLERARAAIGDPVPARAIATPVERKRAVDPPGSVADATIRAPVLGYFHRGAVAGSVPFASIGDRLAEGVTVGAVSVLGERYDVVTAGPVEVRDFLVDDGQPVEYGQPLVRVHPIPAARQEIGA